MTLFELKRTGFPGLTFNGEILAQQPGVDLPEKSGQRHHDITVYRTDDARLIVAISFHTSHLGEVADSIVEEVDDLTQLEETLSLYNPEIHFDAESQTRKTENASAISRELTRRYDLQVNAVLQDAQVGLAANDTQSTP